MIIYILDLKLQLNQETKKTVVIYNYTSTYFLFYLQNIHQELLNKYLLNSQN